MLATLVINRYVVNENKHIFPVVY